MLNLQAVVVITPVAAGEKTPTTRNRETTKISIIAGPPGSAIMSEK